MLLHSKRYIIITIKSFIIIILLTFTKSNLIRKVLFTSRSITSTIMASSSIIPPSSSSSSSSSSSRNNFYKELPLYVQRLSEHAILPTRGSQYAAGFDLSSASDDTIIKGNGGRTLIKTDLRIACPPGTYLRIAPRSGLAYKHGIDIGAGVIDADYRGPIGVIVFNFGNEDFVVKRGDRIAQAILEQICVPSAIIDIPIEEELPVVGVRGENGFGSTGVATNVESNKKSRVDDETAMITPSTTTDEQNDESMNDDTTK